MIQDLAKPIGGCRTYQEALTSLMTSGGAERSLKEWSQRFGYRSHRSLGMVMSGKRLPTPKMVESISRYFHLDPGEHRSLELLVHEARTGEMAIHAQMGVLRQALTETELINLKDFAQISEWYMFVVKQLATTPSFRKHPEWIARRLRRKVDPRQLATALATLERLGLLKTKNVRTRNDIPSAALRMHHLQMLQRAAQSINQDPVTERENLSLTLRFDSKQMMSVKRYLREVREEFDRRFGSDTSEEVFQLLVHFFPQTSKEVR
ncbi:MAG: DUF4423 domain-containing protein [Deltaproteobacteria bacterium]|nr:DUF4423 domain-containing protein [Deltaproteobacteria bacterium]MBI3294242.1 DUF4423 domain-containing protein [Deltaproteobacteria bacterium]